MPSATGHSFLHDKRGPGRVSRWGRCMSSDDRYRQYAADCVHQAQGEESQDDKTLLLNIALAWLRLARQTETVDAPEFGEIVPEPRPIEQPEMAT